MDDSKADKARRDKNTAWNNYYHVNRDQYLYEDLKHKWRQDKRRRVIKSFWKFVRSKTKCKATIGELKKPDGQVADSIESKANTLNDYYHKVFTTEDISHIPQPRHRHNGDILDQFVIYQEEVRKKLKKLKISSAGGPDGIQLRGMWWVSCSTNQVISAIIGWGTLPHDWKQANITPIFKKGCCTEPGNYRPVSLTPVICKLMESVIRDQIMNHLRNNLLLSESQFGFRKGRSCALQLINWSSRQVGKGYRWWWICGCGLPRFQEGIWHCSDKVATGETRGSWYTR